MASKKETPAPEGVLPTTDHPDIAGHKVVEGEHDLTGHPALETGTIVGVGGQSEGERKTTAKDPAKKTSAAKSAKRGDGAGPEE